MRYLNLPRAVGAAAILLSATACLDGTTSVDTSATHFSVVTGAVLSRSDGTGILGANVGVRIPVNRVPTAYTAPIAHSDDNGFYTLGIYRTGTAPAATPDTMTVWIIAAVPTPSGAPASIDSAQATITFVPINTTASPTTIDVLLTPP